jgi:hypothetical protein
VQTPHTLGGIVRGPLAWSTKIEAQRPRMGLTPETLAAVTPVGRAERALKQPAALWLASIARRCPLQTSASASPASVSFQLSVVDAVTPA